MYSSCLYCHARLGSNPAIEHLSVGRQVAFDPARGRLWIVCLRCGYWNLTPFEERWEAIDECEHLYEGAVRVVSSDEISLANIADRLTLIRIGTPTRGEFAAWRYGRRLTARRDAKLLKLVSGTLAAGTLAVAGATAGASVGLILYGYLYWGTVAYGGSSPVVVRVPQLSNESHPLTRGDLRFLSLVKRSRQDWRLMLQGYGGFGFSLVGSEAATALSLTLPLLNRFGARRRDVTEATRLLAGSDPRTFIDETASFNSNIARLPRGVRVALEIAAHEDAERAAMGGELALLERAWRESEEIAAIADSLLVPASVHNAWLRLRSDTGARRGA